VQPSHPSLSLQDSERQAFSMRLERVVRYRITVQTPNPDRGRVDFHDSGLLVQSFKLGTNTSVGEVDALNSQCIRSVTAPTIKSPSE